MDSLGNYLKLERESQNLSLRDASESTRIKERLLKAIEEDQYEAISSHVYVKGFLDAYARYLKLDPNDILSRYQENHGKEMIQHSIIPSYVSRWIRIPQKKRNVWPYIASVSVIILLIVISIYYYYS